LLKPAVDLRKICHPGKSFAIGSCQIMADEDVRLDVRPILP
jgi:hypothetical protein